MHTAVGRVSRGGGRGYFFFVVFGAELSTKSSGRVIVPRRKDLLHIRNQAFNLPSATSLLHAPLNHFEMN